MKIKTKKTFGICDFVHTSPPLDELSPDTPKLNIVIGFEEALKLNMAMNECVRKLNSYDRSTIAGKRSALNLVIHFPRKVITITEAALPKP